jgi:murein DD-endopeptidase MepM/ murein hydrolase activator NlpD
VTSSCYVSQFFATAVAPGVIARTAEGVVILDLDGDGDESTGWTILYLHMAAQDRVQAGTVVQAGDKIGHPSCEGGVSTGTHMHIARRYNGEWIPVSCNDACAPGIVRPALVMSGWTFYGLPDQLYQGGMLKQGDRRVADQEGPRSSRGASRSVRDGHRVCVRPVDRDRIRGAAVTQNQGNDVVISAANHCKYPRCRWHAC